jgi:hypothetical protein
MGDSSTVSGIKRPRSVTFKNTVTSSNKQRASLAPPNGTRRNNPKRMYPGKFCRCIPGYVGPPVHREIGNNSTISDRDVLWTTSKNKRNAEKDAQRINIIQKGTTPSNAEQIGIELHKSLIEKAEEEAKIKGGVPVEIIESSDDNWWLRLCRGERLNPANNPTMMCSLILLNPVKSLKGGKNKRHRKHKKTRKH